VSVGQRRQRAISALRESWLAVAQGRVEDLMFASLFDFGARVFPVDKEVDEGREVVAG